MKDDRSFSREEGRIEVPGGRVWYLRLGKERQGTPLLVLHGGPGAPHDYLEGLGVLADERPVIFYDQLGCGNSSVPNDARLWTVERFVMEMQEVRRKLDLERMHVLASSWGTMLLTAYISKYGTDGLVGLVMSGPAISAQKFVQGARSYLEEMPEPMRHKIAEAEREGNFADAGYQEAMMYYYHRHVCRLDPWPECLERTMAKMSQSVYRTMWGPSEFTLTGNLRDYDGRGVLGSIGFPVLYTCGEFDEAEPTRVKGYVELTPHAELAVFKECSHMHHLEDQEKYELTVRSFLRRAEGDHRSNLVDDKF